MEVKVETSVGFRKTKKPFQRKKNRAHHKKLYLSAEELKLRTGFHLKGKWAFISMPPPQLPPKSDNGSSNFSGRMQGVYTSVLFVLQLWMNMRIRQQILFPSISSIYDEFGSPMGNMSLHESFTLD